MELYRFRYDATGRLSNIITNVPYVEGSPPTSKDTLIYGNTNNSAELTSIIRNPKSGNPYTFTLASTGGSIFNSSWTFDFQGTRYAQNCQEPNCGGTWGGNYDVFPASGGFPTGVLNMTSLQMENLSMEDRNHSLDQQGCGSCIRYLDTFYFHPLMVLKDRFELGDQLLFIYMVDWWQPVSTQQSDNNEKVTLTFKYDL